MGKSAGNAIYLSDDTKTVAAKVKMALTDPGRITRTDKGNPDICIVSQYHKVFGTAEYDEICSACRGGKIGCAACKQRLSMLLDTLLAPIRERCAYYEAHKAMVRELIAAGSEKAAKIGAEKMRHVKAVMHLAL